MDLRNIGQQKHNILIQIYDEINMEDDSVEQYYAVVLLTCTYFKVMIGIRIVSGGLTIENI